MLRTTLKFAVVGSRSVPYAIGAAILAVVLAPTPGFAQPGPRAVQAQEAAVAQAAPKPITLDDYDTFRRITGASISSDGQWMLYTVTPNDGDATLYVQSLDTDTVHEIARGANASFSDAGGWLGYFVNPPSENGRGGRGGGRGAAQGEDDEAPPRAFTLLNLATGEDMSFAGVGSFDFSPDGEWLLMRPGGGGAGPGGGGRGGRGGGRGGAPQDAAAPGADLIMRHLSSGSQRYVGNVGSYSFNEAGDLMAYTVRGQERLGNGVYVMTVASGDARMLDGAAADYDRLSWNEAGTHLAVLRGDKASDRMQKDNVVLAWSGVGASQTQMMTFDPAEIAGVPDGMVVSEFAALRWNDEGTRILLGIKEQEPEADEPDEPQANVDVWHWADEQPQSRQIVSLNQDLRSTYTALLDIASGTIRQLTDEEMSSVTPTDDLAWAIGRNSEAYTGELAWGGSRADIYRINLATGEQTLIERGLTRTMGLSPDGAWFLYLRNGQVFSYEMATGTKTRIDGGRSFVNAEDDHDYEKPVYGTAGFTADGRSALFYDRYDVWALSLMGESPVNLTKGVGADQEIQFRVTRLGGGGGGRGGGRGGGGGGEPIDLSEPIMLRASGQYTKKTGYYELAPGGSPTSLIWDDKSIGNPIVADDADRMIFTQQTFNEYPNYWLSDRRFSSARQVTDAHPDLFETFAWGTKQLIDYENSKGQRLQATLTLPANYEPGRQYPMLVYFYEIMSNTHHNFQVPRYDDRPHMATYASNGYLVLQPDIVYEIGKPGSSALDCISAAVNKVIELGYADPDHVGLQGHSWGGYQSSFIVTQTDMFAAVVTGAPPTDLTSFYGTLYRSSGNIQQGITEVGQVRMGREVTPWNARDLYESQSPIHNAPNITTPFMILHGTNDGSVDWGQGLEFYAAARRLGKEVIFLSYPDEGHHLGRRENQKDFQIRMRQFFDHYLKGEPAPAWMTEGVPQVKKGR